MAVSKRSNIFELVEPSDQDLLAENSSTDIPVTQINYKSPKTHQDFILRPFENSDSEAVIDILNYFIKHSFAAYPDQQLESEFIEYIKDMTKHFPFYFIETPNHENVGFGLVHPYDRSRVFDRTGELTIFILPIFTGTGLGRILLDLLFRDSRQLGIRTLLSSISALNEMSINFHLKQGFEECGRFKKVCRKNGQTFDIIWLQKFI